MPDKAGAMAGMRRFLQREADANTEWGWLGRLNDGGTQYEFMIPEKPGHSHCRIDRGNNQIEFTDCIPRVALDPYVRCRFEWVDGVLEAVKFEGRDAVRNYGDGASAIDVPAYPPRDRGALQPPPVFGDPVVKLLADGVASAGTDRFLLLAAETSTSDDCDGLTGLAVGDEVWLFADAGDTITLRHNSGSPTDKFQFYNEANIELSGSKGLRVVKRASGAIVNSADESGGGGAFTDLSDVPSSYSGEAGKYVQVNGTEDGLQFAAPASGGAGSYLLFRDEKTQNTNAGGFTAGAWQPRELTVEAADPDGYGSLSSNQITLAAGTYRVRISCPAFLVGPHQARLQDITNTATLLVGTSAYAEASGTGSNRDVTCSFIDGRITLAGTTVLEVQHRCTTTKTVNGFGIAANLATEVYTVAEFIRE